MQAAMVQIVENHAEIVGELVGIEADPARPAFVTLRVTVHRVSDVAGTPNFFANDVGRTIAITTRRDSPLATRHPGAIGLRVKKTGLDASFAEDEVPTGG